MKAEVDLQEIKKVRVLTERLKKLKEEWEMSVPVVCVEDSILFTESWKETEGLPLDIRWAKAFEKRLLKRPILIRDGELIVGSLAGKLKGVVFIAATKPREIWEMLRKGVFDRKYSDTTGALISKEDRGLLEEDVKYWMEWMEENKGSVEYINRTLRYFFGEEHLLLLMEEAGVLEGRGARKNPERGLFENWAAFGGGVPHPHKKVLDKGLNYIISMAQAELRRMEEEGAGSIVGNMAFRKRNVLESVIISCKAVIEFARRHAALARELASRERDPRRKKELEQIAGHCDWVPANPPRSFWEALQSLRFLHLACWIECPERPEVALGRLDQMLYPYYERDLKEGKITRQQAAELLGCFWLKTRENETLVAIKREHRAAPGTMLQNVTLGGRDEKGRDMTNELSYLILETMRQMKLSEPAVYIRYHEGMPESFLLHALECNRDYGGGNPAFLNDTLGTARYLARGVKVEDAVDWYASGCLAYNLDCAEHASGKINLNLAKIFEITLYDGYDPRIGKKVGLRTGDVREFDGLRDFFDAFFNQVDYFAKKMREHYFIWWSIQNETTPWSGWRVAMQFEDCIAKGIPPREGGARYPVTCMMWVGYRGLVDVADSLAAIKYLVFDKRMLTMQELMEAMEVNWKGKEDIRQLCLNAPKFGNDDDYVDDIFNYLSQGVQEILLKRPDPFTGMKPFLFVGAAAGHVIHGMYVGALPNGRLAYTPLCDAATSPMPGMDQKGPTAVINSATKWFHAWNCVGYTHNMKLSKQLMNTWEKLEKVAHLVKTFMKRGGWHIQFNIVDAQELVEARKHPDRYRHLLVRVGGYSAYFVDLPPELQDEIINRTMHEL